ncbi:transporter [Ganoderma sinense ZZ0214-1]|uniref:Transporter n=1 Tax=Ganoderma sinense ZZ0214-1 TaxID=1077348 RepID=A0A2G8RNQ4_9APHY|nr:transporter [Ganoderma sinense ZZ0214-1]
MSSSDGQPQILFSATRVAAASSGSNTPVALPSTDVQFRVVLAKLAPELYSLFVFKAADAAALVGEREPQVSLLIGDDTWTAHAEQTGVVTVGRGDRSDVPQIYLHLRFDDKEDFWTFLRLLIAAKESAYKRNLEICDLIRQAIALVPQDEVPMSSVSDVSNSPEDVVQEQTEQTESSASANLQTTFASQSKLQLRVHVPLEYITGMEARIAALQAELKHLAAQHQSDVEQKEAEHQSELQRKDDHYRLDLERKDAEFKAYVEKKDAECSELRTSVRLNRYVWDSFSRQNKEFESMLYPFLDPDTRRIQFPLVTFPALLSIRAQVHRSSKPMEVQCLMFQARGIADVNVGVVQASSSASGGGQTSASSSAVSSAILSSEEEQKFVPAADLPIHPPGIHHSAPALPPHPQPPSPGPPAPAPAPVPGPPAPAPAPVLAPLAPVLAPVPAVAPIHIVGVNAEIAHARRFAGLVAVFGTLFRSVMDALRVVIVLLKVPFIVFLFAYLSLLLLGRVVDTASERLAPVCNIFPNLPICRVTAAADNLSATLGNVGRKPVNYMHRVDFPGLMDLQSRTLDQLLAQSTSGSQLALSIKQAELAVKDLGIVVKASNLTSKDVLAQALEEFAQEAKLAGRDLQRLSAKLYGTVDTVLAFDDYALRSLASAQTSGADVRETAVAMFRSTMTSLALEVTRVILDATAVAASLDALEEKLSIIRSLCEQEMVLTKSNLSDVLSELWSTVGGNKDKIYHLTNQVEILRNVDWYRSLSVAHVVATTEILLTLKAELSELRDKLNTPELIGDAIPIEVQIASIERGARRIKEEKLKTRQQACQVGDGSAASTRRQGLLGSI